MTLRLLSTTNLYFRLNLHNGLGKHYGVLEAQVNSALILNY